MKTFRKMIVLVIVSTLGLARHGLAINRVDAEKNSRGEMNFSPFRLFPITLNSAKLGEISLTKLFRLAEFFRVHSVWSQ